MLLGGACTGRRHTVASRFRQRTHIWRTSHLWRGGERRHPREGYARRRDRWCLRRKRRIGHEHDHPRLASGANAALTHGRQNAACHANEPPCQSAPVCGSARRWHRCRGAHGVLLSDTRRCGLLSRTGRRSRPPLCGQLWPGPHGATAAHHGAGRLSAPGRQRPARTARARPAAASGLFRCRFLPLTPPPATADHWSAASAQAGVPAPADRQARDEPLRPPRRSRPPRAIPRAAVETTNAATAPGWQSLGRSLTAAQAIVLSRRLLPARAWSCRRSRAKGAAPGPVHDPDAKIGRASTEACPSLGGCRDSRDAPVDGAGTDRDADGRTCRCRTPPWPHLLSGMAVAAGSAWTRAMAAARQLRQRC